MQFGHKGIYDLFNEILSKKWWNQKLGTEHIVSGSTEIAMCC